MRATATPIYLDNAATSFPKPEAVYAAVDHYQRELGAPAGRGAYQRALQVSALVERTRTLLARMFHVEHSARLIFTKNATEGLNGVLQGLLRQGDHVITSNLEHNSVVRPLHALQQSRGIEVTTIPAQPSGIVSATDFQSALRHNTRLIVLTHASNVTGAIQPVEEVGAVARTAGVRFLVDAAQTAGHLPIDVAQLPVDYLVAAGHKGLLGPLGTGILYIRPGQELDLEPWFTGGTGSHSEDPNQPHGLPEKYESGNLNAPGIIGLGAAAEYLLEHPPESQRAHELALLTQFREGLQSIPGLKLYLPENVEEQVGVVSLNVGDVDPHTIATILDQNFGLEVRAGLHCAPGAHRHIGSFEQGGAVRFSFGPFTTSEHITRAVDALTEIAVAFP
ncbi:MAG: aminotransferase class V-fold PLP-dependent enzyme [Planctomycetales bacterium]